MANRLEVRKAAVKRALNRSKSDWAIAYWRRVYQKLKTSTLDARTPVAPTLPNAFPRQKSQQSRGSTNDFPLNQRGK